MKTEESSITFVENTSASNSFAVTLKMDISEKRVALVTGKSWEEVLKNLGRFLDENNYRPL